VAGVLVDFLGWASKQRELNRGGGRDSVGERNGVGVKSSGITSHMRSKKVVDWSEKKDFAAWQELQGGSKSFLLHVCVGSMSELTSWGSEDGGGDDKNQAWEKVLRF